MAYEGNYLWGTSPTNPNYMPVFSPDSSPRSANSALNYNSGGSDFSASSAHSSRTSHGAAVYVNGHKVADIPASTTHSSGSSRRAQDGSVEGARRPHRRTRRNSTVVINADDIPRSSRGHGRHGSHTSFNSHGSASRDPTTTEPESIYIEENVGDARPPRALIYDNRGRTRHRSHGSQGHPSDVQINVHPASRSRSRPQRSRSASRAAPPAGRVMSWSDEEDARGQLRRKSSMKRAGSKHGRRKSVSFSPENEVIDLADKFQGIRLQNHEIETRPAIPDIIDPYYRPQVTARTYTPVDIEMARIEDERRHEEERLERLRMRQQRQTKVSHPPITRHERRGRRNSVVVTAPPMGVFNPYASY